MHALNETHDPGLRSWVESANEDGADFPIQNLPFGVLRRRGSWEDFRPAVAIGDQALDLTAARRAGVLEGAAGRGAAACDGPTLNRLMSLDPAHWSELRLAISQLLRRESPHAARLRDCLIPQAQAEYKIPAAIGDYTDFFSSIYHATAAHESAPVFGASQQLDYELELGIFLGPGNEPGRRIWTIAQMVTHHTSNGCNLAPGDLFGSGTQSGPAEEEAGSMLELTHGGKLPLQLPNGETCGFLEDGDTVTFYGRCEREGCARIGFGHCAGTVMPALLETEREA